MSVEDRVKSIKWEYNNEEIIKKYEFISFKDGIEFITDLADIVEKFKIMPMIIIDGNNITVKVKCKMLNEHHITFINSIEKIYDRFRLGDKELDLLLKEEEKERARHRTRGPYRKSSTIGL